MATSNNGDEPPREQARFYTHDEIVQSQPADRRAFFRKLVNEEPSKGLLYSIHRAVMPQRTRGHVLRMVERAEVEVGRPLSDDEARALVALKAKLKADVGYLSSNSRS